MNAIWKISACVTSLAAFACSALGAEDGYKPEEIAPEGGWIKFAFLAIFIIGVLVVAFKNPKRTHLD